MVTSLDDIQLEKRNSRKGGMVVELVGPAGVGKSTLFHALGKKGFPWLECQYTPPVWKISTTPFYIKNIYKLLPIIIRQLFSNDRRITRRELAFMAILNGWHEKLDKEVANSNKIIVLDEGPISLMAYLNIWGPKCLFSSNMHEWWENIYGKWMHGLDMVVMLDTTDEILIWRINNRPRDHHIKGEPVPEMLDWITKYRILNENIVSRLLSNVHAIRVLRIDSGKYSVDEIVNKVLHEFNTKVENIDQ